MKKVLFLALSLALTGLSACTERVVEHRTTVHHYRTDGPAVGTPSSEGGDNFHAVTKPDSYSQ